MYQTIPYYYVLTRKKHAFYSILAQITTKDSEEIKMINQENIQPTDAEFAEKCRKALEQSYGLNIPMPKAIDNKDSLHKKFKIF